MVLDERPLFSLLDDSIVRDPDHPFLDFLGRGYSYREVGDLVDKTASGLRRLGVRRGAKVGLLLPNCPYYVVCFFAVLKAGGIVVNCNPLSAERQLRAQIEDSETEILVTLDLEALFRKVPGLIGSSRLSKIVVCAMADALPLGQRLIFRLLRAHRRARGPRDPMFVPFTTLIAGGSREPAAEIDPRRDLAVLQYTGGTTGIPKGVCLTHANLYVNAMQIRAWFTGAEPGGESVLAVLPFFHAFGMTAVMNLAIAVGGELIVLPRFDVRQVLHAIERKRATLLVGVPTIFRAIADFPHLARYDLSSLKLCVSGGDALPLDLRRRYEALTGCRLAEGYGLTECSPVVACNPFEGEGKPGSLGLPLPRTMVEIVSLADGRTLLPPGEKGEIRVSGPQVMTGYWKQTSRDGGGSGRRPAAHRRYRLHRHGRLCFLFGTPQGRHRHGRIQCLSALRRGDDPHASRHRRCPGCRRARRLSRPNRQGLYRGAAGSGAP
jgi:long-chain acyl-CoA synthetase